MSVASEGVVAIDSETLRRSFDNTARGNRLAVVTAFASATRGHWSIENSLHWVLDVTFD
ncbi:MAG: hypothetical protein ACKV19_04745 [Verrucomicrobiales bacterium]